MQYRILIGGIGIALLATGCIGPSGATPAEKRLFVDRMARETLQALYEQHPEAKQKVENGVGYGAFSDFGYALVTGGSSHGYGVVVNNQTGARTYMKMLEASYGVGIGVKEFRTAIVFDDEKVLDDFVKVGLAAGAEGDASTATTGGSQVRSLAKGMEVYHITDKGFFLRAALHAAKYYPDKKLNAK